MTWCLIPGTLPGIGQLSGPRNRGIRRAAVLIQNPRAGAIIAGNNRMLVAEERLEIRRSTHSLAQQYESLIRLAEAIRTHRDQKDLFQVLAKELRDVVAFDGICQCDPTGNKVNWHFCETYNSNDRRISDIPKEETVG